MATQHIAESVSSVIHQILHGYADGHTLLAASCELTSVEKKALLLLSDLSGQMGNRNFDSYLTGYPLPGKRYYAFARTWNAPEMPRPGCVWTHTLLLELPLLTRIHNLSGLNGLFKRPQSDSENIYSTAIPINTFIHSITNTLYNPKPSFYTIAYYLYSKTRDTIIIPAEGAADYEEDILNIWRQQWPRLRRSFSFCTGSLSLREVDNKLLDCQVVPEDYSARLSRQHVGNISVVDFSTSDKTASWFKVYQDMEPAILQQFMYKYGSDIIGKRSKFTPMCLACAVLNGGAEYNISFDLLLKFFKQYFSSIKEAKRLKADLIEKTITTTPDGEYNFVKTLLTSPDIDILAESEWNFPEQIIRLWSEGKATEINISRLLEELDTSRLSEAHKLHLLSGLPLEIWIDVRWVTASLLAEVINIKPQILADPIFWKSTVYNQRIGLDIFVNPEYSSTYSQFGNIISAMLNAQNDKWAENLSSRFNYFALLAALDWSLDKPNAVLPRNWQDLVWTYPSEYLFWLASNQHYTAQHDETMLQLFVAKDFNADALDEKQTKILLTQVLKIPFSSLRTKAMAIWLAKGLNDTHPAAKEITILLFQPIYNIAAQNRLDFASWHILAPSYERARESFGFSKFFNRLFSESKPQADDWDKCGQLRQKIVESCILGRWPSELICKAISNIDTFEMTMKYSLQFETGRDFFRRVLLFVQQNKVYKDSSYAKIMNAEHDKVKKRKKKHQ